MSALHWPRDSRDSCLCSLGLNSLIFKGGVGWGGVIRNLTSLGPLQWEYFCMLLSMFCFWALYLFLLMSDYDLKNFSAFSTVSSFSCVETTLPGVACFFPPFYVLLRGAHDHFCMSDYFSICCSLASTPCFSLPKLLQCFPILEIKRP